MTIIYGRRGADVIGVAIFLLFTAGMVHAAETIDDFSTAIPQVNRPAPLNVSPALLFGNFPSPPFPNFGVTPNGVLTNTTTTVGTDIVGGARTTTLTGQAAFGQIVAADAGGGSLVFFTGSSSFGKLNLRYDGNSAGLGSALANNEIITIKVDFLDLGSASSLDITVTVTDNSSKSSSSPGASITTAAPLSFDFGSSGVDFGDLASISIDFVSTPQSAAGGGVDFTLSGISATGAPLLPVPEPASLAAWTCLAAVMLGLRRRFELV